MKKITFLSYLFYFHVFILSAQMPNTFKYQGLARNHDLTTISNTDLSLRASILADGPTGAVVYRELHNTITTATGIFTLNIGEGSAELGDFYQIPWSDGRFYLKMEIDVDGSGIFEFAGVSPLLAVPFAMHAHSAELIDDADANPRNEIQTLAYNETSHELTISEGNTVKLSQPNSDNDSDPINEIQTLDFDVVSNTLSISGGNSVTFPAPADDADSDPTNEIQTLNFNVANNKLEISGGNSITLPLSGSDNDSDPLNEIQTLVYNTSSNRISISGGNEIQLPADNDRSPDNELQELSVFKQFKPLAPLRLNISKGNQIDIPVTSVWNYSTKNDAFSQIYTSVPVTTQSFTAELVEVTPRPAQWDYPRITPDEYQFRTAKGSTGMRMSKNRLAHHYGSGLGQYNMYLDNKSLRYYNNSGNILSEVGGTQFGLMKIYSGTSFNPYFTVEKAGNKARMSFGGVAASNTVFTLLENGNSASAVWYGNGSSSVIISGSGSKAGHGAIYVSDAKSATQAGMYVDAQGRGVLYADIKNFVVPHPDDQSKEIVYASLEGPEAAIYLRGTAKLMNGEAVIKFSNHFSAMLAKNNMTVILTPLSADSQGLAVIEKNSEGIKVKELHQSKGNYEFDWEVKGIRKGYEDFEAVRDKR